MRLKVLCFTSLLAASFLAPGLAQANPEVKGKAVAQATESSLVLPYAKAGLTKREAAVHLLNRFSFGPERREADVLVYVGLENWLDQQLRADQSEAELDQRLKPYPSLRMTDHEIVTHYLEGNQMVDRAVAEGGFKKVTGKETPEERKAYDAAIQKWGKEHGLHPMNELRNELLAYKLLRAVYAKNELSEVLTDFWFNHFNTSYNTAARPYMLSYERDAIRPNALAPFATLLMATAKHPAMLAYLNNAQSVANADEPTTLELLQKKVNAGRRKGKAGLNENYGREVMELHTLGVDGGYTQHDVTEVARALTGWTIVPQSGPQRKSFDEGKPPAGSIIQGDFLFRAEAHDAGPKTIMGRKFPGGAGLEEGEEVLAMLAQHPSTARFISRQLAIHFVSDAPPEALVKRMAETFQRSGGDTRQVIRTMVQSPEFWAPEARGAKVKSPFELVASSLRALDADIQPDGAIYGWIDRMGQPLYSYAPPTGFPDRAQSWVNSGTLTYRMNYALNLTSGGIKGARPDLVLLRGLVPLRPEKELERVAGIFFPGRNLAQCIAELTPLVKDPDFARKVAMATEPGKKVAPPAPAAKKIPFSQVVGILIGSPEFQRR